jgi:hypothetical protein
METVSKFVRTAGSTIASGHVPYKPGLNSPQQMAVLREHLVPLAQKAWKDIIAPEGQLPFSHDCQPPGTLVRRVTRRGGHFGSAFEDVPIETILEGTTSSVGATA